MFAHTPFEHLSYAFSYSPVCPNPGSRTRIISIAFVTASLTVTWSDRYLNQILLLVCMQPHPNQLWPRREDGWEQQHKILPWMVF